MLDLRLHVGHADHDQAGGALVEALAGLLEVLPAHPGGGVAGDGAEHGTPGRRTHEQAGADRRRGEQGDHETGGQADAAAEHAAHSGGRLVLLDDLDLAVLAVLDDRGVVGVDESGFGVQGLYGVVVGLGVGDVGVGADEGEEGVDGHDGSFQRISGERTEPSPELL